MLEKLNVLLTNDDILFFNEDFKKIPAVYLNKTNLDNDKNFNEDDPVTTIHVIHVRLLVWRSKFLKMQNTLKKKRYVKN